MIECLIVLNLQGLRSYDEVEDLEGCKRNKRNINATLII